MVIKMIIIGADISVNSPGFVKFELDNNLDISKKSYFGFTQVKKHESENIHYFKKDMFNNDYSQFEYMLQKIKLFADVVDYLSFEDYAFSAVGRITQIAEFSSVIKMDFYRNNTKLRAYDIPSIKMFATGKGNGDKLYMEDAYNALQSTEKFDLSHLPNKGKSPASDIIDAFWIAKLLQTELKLRKGLIALKDLTEKQIQIFNRTTKSQKENLLSTDFYSKELT